MKISVYTKFGPINSKKVFKAFIESLEKAGEEIQLNCNGNRKKGYNKIRG